MSITPHQATQLIAFANQLEGNLQPVIAKRDRKLGHADKLVVLLLTKLQFPQHRIAALFDISQSSISSALADAQKLTKL